MTTVGIVCEYNPFHPGHAYHINETRAALGEECAVVCVMSGNFVQRGDFAVFGKHPRAEAAVRCGVDLVVELPSPYVLSSAEGFASAGVHILDALSICDYISFGSESGDIGALLEVVDAIGSPEARTLIRENLGKGLPYASALQKAADHVLGERSQILKSPNNLLGVEYLRAIASHGSRLAPMTIKRTGGAHDGDTGYSASAVRNALLAGNGFPAFMPQNAAALYGVEIAGGRGPVSMSMYEQAMLSRLRSLDDFSELPGASEGLDRRLLRFAISEPTIEGILNHVKTKRYPMSRIRRMLLCACLGISAADIRTPPPYIKVLAMNDIGMKLLKDARKTAALPIITKPASAKKLSGRAAELFQKEAAATDFYVLGFQDGSARAGGQEWRETPRVVCCHEGL